MTIISPRGARFRICYERDGVAIPATTVRRLVLDAALVESALDAGVEMLEGCVVRDPILEHGTVRGVRGTVAGRPVEVRAPVTIAADGSHSVLARRLGMASSARWPVRLGLVAHYRQAGELEDGFGQMHVGARGYCGIAPLPDGLLNVSVVVRADALRRERLSASAYLEGWIAEHPHLRSLLDGARRETPVRGVLPVGTRTRRAGMPGLLLAGDAAGFFDPFTGEGIYRALRCAELIDRLMAENGRPDIGPHQVARYEEMRASAFRGKEAVTALVQLFVSRPALLEYALPRLAIRPAAHLPLSAVLGDIAPAGHFLNPRALWAALMP
jgi:flavin-dependent dehydrogenase